MNPVPKVGVLLSGILGNHTISKRLLESLKRIGVQPDLELWLTHEDYQRYPAPPLLRRISSLEATYVARRALHAAAPATDPDVVIVNSYELAAAAHTRFPRARLIVALDATPAMVRDLRARIGESPLRRLARLPLSTLLDARFSVVARHVWRWLPISKYCADSLTHHYGVARDQCRVMRAPQVQLASTFHRAAHQRRQLLFVGNDFLRKGGDRLVHALIRGLNGVLAERCALTLVTNDPYVRTLDLPPNIRALQGISGPEQLSALYREQDLLVLPTSYDIYPNVLCEALAQGTPFLATDLPGIRELIDESGAGWPLPLHANPDAIAEAIGEALESDLPAARARALDYARRHLTTESLDVVLRELLSGQACSTLDLQEFAPILDHLDAAPPQR